MISVEASLPECCDVCRGGQMRLVAAFVPGKRLVAPLRVHCPHHDLPKIPYWPFPVRKDTKR